MQERNVGLARLCVVKNGVPRTEGPARPVLTGQSHRSSFEEKRPEGERFGIMPFVGAAGFENFALMIDDDAFYFRLKIKSLRYSREAIDNCLQRLFADGGWF